MKLFKKWKPKQKLRKEDIPFLLSEYRALRSATQISLSFGISLIGIGVFALFAAGRNLDGWEKFFIFSCLYATFIFLFIGIYLHQKSSKLSELLEIEKRLKRYGIKD